jgi:hypothetical protein
MKFRSTFGALDWGNAGGGWGNPTPDYFLWAWWYGGSWEDANWLAGQWANCAPEYLQ